MSRTVSRTFGDVRTEALDFVKVHRVKFGKFAHEVADELFCKKGFAQLQQLRCGIDVGLVFTVAVSIAEVLADPFRIARIVFQHHDQFLQVLVDQHLEKADGVFADAPPVGFIGLEVVLVEDDAIAFDLGCLFGEASFIAVFRRLIRHSGLAGLAVFGHTLRRFYRGRYENPTAACSACRAATGRRRWR
jgi:hypothetical protein